MAGDLGAWEYFEWMGIQHLATPLQSLGERVPTDAFTWRRTSWVQMAKPALLSCPQVCAEILETRVAQEYGNRSA